MTPSWALSPAGSTRLRVEMVPVTGCSLTDASTRRRTWHTREFGELRTDEELGRTNGGEGSEHNIANGVVQAVHHFVRRASPTTSLHALRYKEEA